MLHINSWNRSAMWIYPDCRVFATRYQHMLNNAPILLPCSSCFPRKSHGHCLFLRSVDHRCRQLHSTAILLYSRQICLEWRLSDRRDKNDQHHLCYCHSDKWYHCIHPHILENSDLLRDGGGIRVVFCIFLREERPASDFEDSSTHWAAVFHVSRP